MERYKKEAMPTYIHLITYTPEGLANVADHDPHPQNVIESLGVGEIKADYLTFGQYDIVVITEFPDDETAAQFALTMAGGGHSTTETLKAFPPHEFREIVTGLPELSDLRHGK